MAIVQTPQYWIKNITIIGMVAILAACGGGSGGSSNSSSAPSIDTKPEAFSFARLDNQLLGEEVTSNSVSITGINSAATIAITNGQYAIGEAAFTEAAGTITNGQSVKVKLTASEDTFTETTATLTVGGVSANFTVKTQPDITPDTFSFTPAENVEPASVNTSDKVALSGFDIAVPIIIKGGEYALDDGEFTTADGEVEPGQSVTVRMTASEALRETVEAVVTIGGVAGTYAVTTLADTTAPTAEFMFPPPVSMTEGDRIRIRGKIADKYSEIASDEATITINGTTQPLALTANEDGTKSWDLPGVALVAGENTIIIATEDNLGNREENAAKVMIRQDASLGSFPNADNQLSNPGAVVIDRLNGRNRLIVADRYGSSLHEIDLATAQRKLFVDLDFSILTDILLDKPNERILVRDNSANIIQIKLDDPQNIFHTNIPSIGEGYTFTFNDEWELTASSRKSGDLLFISSNLELAEVFSANTDPDQGIPMPVGRGMAYDKFNHRYLLSTSAHQTVYAIDSTTGVRSILSSENVGGGDAFGAYGTAGLMGITVDEENQRILVSEEVSGKLFSIDSKTGDRKILTSPVIPNTFNPMYGNYDLAVNTFESYAYVCDELNHEIFAVDLITGERVYFSKN